MKIKTYVKIFFILFIIAGYFIISNCYGLYSDTIIKITDIQSSEAQPFTGANGKTELSYTQDITAVILNGPLKGREVSFSNYYQDSLTKYEKYSVNDALFINVTSSDSENIEFRIISLKRDQYVFLLIAIFLFALIMVSKRQGIFTIFSLIVNVLLIWLCLNYFSVQFFNYLWIPCISFFCIFTLICAGGFNKKTLGAVLASIITALLGYAIFMITVGNDSGISYEFIEYYISPTDIKKIYMVSVITGCLGSVMDVSITITSSVNELVNRAPDISLKDTVNSIQEIGYDIMGTMVSVLFFSYMSSLMPVFVLRLHSGITLSSILNYFCIFDIIRFLAGSITIVLAIPVAGFISVLLFRREKLKNA